MTPDSTAYSSSVESCGSSSAAKRTTTGVTLETTTHLLSAVAFIATSESDTRRTCGHSGGASCTRITSSGTEVDIGSANWGVSCEGELLTGIGAGIGVTIDA